MVGSELPFARTTTPTLEGWLQKLPGFSAQNATNDDRRVPTPKGTIEFCASYCRLTLRVDLAYRDRRVTSTPKFVLYEKASSSDLVSNRGLRPSTGEWSNTIELLCVLLHLCDRKYLVLPMQ